MSLRSSTSVFHINSGRTRNNGTPMKKTPPNVGAGRDGGHIFPRIWVEVRGI
jgi:hypothetical protein